MKNVITNKVILIFSILMLAITINACRKTQMPITEAERFANEDIKSYANLFEVFWKTMDQRYNYFYEQKRIDGMDWDAIYKEYHPKFSALKSFNRGKEHSDNQIINDADSAKSYFKKIIDPIIDRHFGVLIFLPASRFKYEGAYFYANMKDTSTYNSLGFKIKFNYMSTKVIENRSVVNNLSAFGVFFGNTSPSLIVGPLKSHPDVYYMTFEQFDLSAEGGYRIDFEDSYLSPDLDNKLLVTRERLLASEQLNKITNPQIRTIALNAVMRIVNTYNLFFTSQDVTRFNALVKEFKNTDVMTDGFLSLAFDLERQLELLIQDYYFFNLLDQNLYPTEVIMDRNGLAFCNWFTEEMFEHAVTAHGLGPFQDALTNIKRCANYYQRFLNPLQKGLIKKIIVDLRGNKGGDVLDARFLVDRFITDNKVYAYQRTKQGNNRFDYTPWVPVTAQKNKFGTPRAIPMVILTDKMSFSMSELCALAWKSQGSHVATVGDFTAGATAGLGPADYFNGGIVGETAGGYFDFFMPLMATKDYNGKVIEGIGIKPDYFVTPISKAELTQANASPNTFIDRAFEEALRVINGM